MSKIIKILIISIVIVPAIANVTSAERSHYLSRFHLLSDKTGYDFPFSPKLIITGEEPLVYDTSMFWNSMVDVVIQDTLAYCAMQNGLLILNVSDKVNPRSVSHLYLEEGHATDIKVDGNYAFMTEWDSAFYVIDITSPVTPAIAGKYTTPEIPYGIDIVDSLAFIAYGKVTSDIGLLILNVNDPANITSVADVPAEGGINGMLKVQVESNYAYVVGDGFLWILDITAPSTPVTESRTYTDFYPVELYIRDTLVFLADLDPITPADFSAFSIFDVSDVSAPALLSREDLFGNVAGVIVSDTIAYVANGEYGMQIYNIADPANPDSLGLFANGGITGKIEVSGGYAYLVDYWSEAFSIVAPYPVHFQIVDVSDPINPQLTGGFPFHWKTNTVIYWDGYAYALSNTNFDLDVIVVDLSSTPDSVGYYQTPGAAQDGFFYNDTLYLAAPYAGLEVIDISDPPNPILVRRYTALGAFDVIIRDGYAYVACGYAGVRIFDITDPTDVPVASFTLPDFSAEVALYENYLYIANALGGLFAYDITNPENPTYIDKIGFDQYSYSNVLVSGDRLYANSQIFDLLANPEDPIYLGWAGGGDLLTDLITLGPYAIMSLGRDGIKIVNDSDPQNVEHVFSYNTPGWANRINLSENYLLVADVQSFILLENHIITDVETDSESPLPEAFTLAQNSPNPFNSVTDIDYEFPRRSHVKITVFNILGQRVTTLVNESKAAGSYRVEWDGRDDNGIDVSSGIYFYRLELDSYDITKKMVLLK